MTHAKFFSLLVASCVLLYGAVASYFLPLASFESELTRMGQVPEREFGWRAPQPALQAEWMRQASWQEADVLVIGDSFSDSRVWQTVLTRQGLKVHTEHWSAIRGVCEDFQPWLRRMGFQGRHVVLEVVERNVASGLPALLPCQKMDPHFSVLANQPRPLPPVEIDREARHSDGRLSIGLQVARNLKSYVQQSSAPNFVRMALANGVEVRRMSNGCRLFSHARCQDSLFLTYDPVADIDDAALEAAVKLQPRLAGLHVVWAFVPTKSTAYLHPNKTFWQRAAARLNAPDLLGMTQVALDEEVVDLYPANNTHFSTTGYLLMGETIWQAMRRGF